MKYSIEIDVTTSKTDHNFWTVKITKKIETDIIGIYERDHSKKYSKAWAADSFVDFLAGELCFDSGNETFGPIEDLRYALHDIALGDLR